MRAVVPAVIGQEQDGVLIAHARLIQRGEQAAQRAIGAFNRGEIGRGHPAVVVADQVGVAQVDEDEIGLLGADIRRGCIRHPLIGAVVGLRLVAPAHRQVAGRGEIAQFLPAVKHGGMQSRPVRDLEGARIGRRGRKIDVVGNAVLGRADAAPHREVGGQGDARHDGARRPRHRAGLGQRIDTGRIRLGYGVRAAAVEDYDENFGHENRNL